MATVDRLGFDMVTRNFYSPIPDWRAESASRWETPSELRGVPWDLDAQLSLLEEILDAHGKEFAPPRDRRPGPLDYFYDNTFFGPLDADVLHAMVRHQRPARVLELGSGYSSLVIAAAAARNRAESHPVEHDVYDPYARDDLAPLIRDRARLHAVSATDVPLERFTSLTAGDVLFVDTTHTVKLASDVNFVVLEVLPQLQPGVVVHFHDIFLPWEYPRDWYHTLEVFWAEQYLLQAYLSGNDRYEVLLGNAALLHAHRSRVAALVPAVAHAHYPGSFWLRAR